MDQDFLECPLYLEDTELLFYFHNTYDNFNSLVVSVIICLMPLHPHWDCKFQDRSRPVLFAPVD